MTIQQIRQRLKIDDTGAVSGGKVTIEASTLQAFDPAGAVGDLLASAFAGKAAAIDGAGANATGGDEIVVTGTGSFALGSYPVSLTISLTNDTQVLLVFSFDATSRKDWLFSTSFPKLPTVFNYEKIGQQQTSLLDYLAVAKGTFLAASGAGSSGGMPLVAGINFAGDVTVNAVFGIIQDVVDKATIPATGTITLPPDDQKLPALADGQVPWGSGKPAPGIDLRIAIGKSLKLGDTMTFAVDALHVYSPATQTWLGNNPTYVPIVALTGEIDLPKLGRKVTVVAEMPVGTAEAEIGLTIQPPTLPAFSDLVDLVGGADVGGTAQKAFSGGVAVGGSDPFSKLEIERASLVAGIENKVPTVLRTSLTVGMPNLNWVLFDKRLFEARSMSATFTVLTPFRSPTLEFDAKGLVQVAGIGIDLEATRKDQQVEVTASLDEKVNLPISRLVSDYLPGVSPPSDLTIDSMILTIAPGQSYTFSLSMADAPNTWKINLGPVDLEFKNVQLLAMKTASGPVSGSFAAEADIAGFELSARYQTPGDIRIVGALPPIKLSQIVDGLTGKKLIAPGGFDLEFSDSYVLIEKTGDVYKFGLGTTIDKISTLVFVIERGASGWGFAAGLNVALDKVGELDGVAATVAQFQKWFPFQDFTLALSTITDTTFTFPEASTFGERFKDAPNIKLPVLAEGIKPGFYLYTTTKFTRQNELLKALIDILKIPEGTLLQAMLAYQESAGIELGVALETYLTPVADPAKHQFDGDLGYQNGAIRGMMTIAAGGTDGFDFHLEAKLKTLIEDTGVTFDIALDVVENGVLVSGSLEAQRPLHFGPLQLTELGVALGITWEAVPSFGFAAALDVEGAFNSSVAILVNTAAPAKSLVAASLSDISLDDIVEHMLPANVASDVPDWLRSVMTSVAIKGYPDSYFDVPTDQVQSFSKALDNYDGDTIAGVFASAGHISGFPSSSEGMTLYVDTPGKTWYITQKGGSGSNPIVTHWQVRRDGESMTVGQEAQLYFAPPGGSKIGGLNYPEGMKVSGELSVLFLQVATEVEILKDKGLLLNTKLGEIRIGKIADDKYVFSMTDTEETAGPELSLSTFKDTSQPKDKQDPHFLVDGKMSILGVERSSYIGINKGGGTINLSGDLIPGVVKGSIKGTLNADEGLDLAGKLSVGIGTIDLGPLGKFSINTGVTGGAEIWANKTSIGTSVEMGFRLAGNDYNLPKITLELKFQDLTDLASILFDAVKKFLENLFKDAKVWAKAAAEGLGWATSKIEGVLTSVYGLSDKEAKAIVAVICPMAVAVTSL